MLQQLTQRGLTANPSKCEIGHAKLDLVGHVVGGGSIQPQDMEIDKIMDIIPRENWILSEIHDNYAEREMHRQIC